MAEHGLFQLDLGDMLHEPGFDTHDELVSCVIATLKTHVDNAALRVTWSFPAGRAAAEPGPLGSQCSRVLQPAMTICVDRLNDVALPRTDEIVTTMSIVDAMAESLRGNSLHVPADGRHRRIGVDDFELLKVIGQGGFGKVSEHGCAGRCSLTAVANRCFKSRSATGLTSTKSTP